MSQINKRRGLPSRQPSGGKGGCSGYKHFLALMVSEVCRRDVQGLTFGMIRGRSNDAVRPCHKHIIVVSICITYCVHNVCILKMYD